ncbi:protein-export chaperone SecB [Isoalcanivorax beigongshangi]|uniref:Protein-export protein SecB n=1 Tax=Isoalcanivorax beigongshangi TaxID=3238810 RepID=A0ABV4AJE6_9GAMM
MSETPERAFHLQRFYVKDLSYEVPGAPEVFLTPVQPRVNLQLNTEARALGDSGSDFEVVLSVTVTAENEDGKVLYLAEVVQAGIFTLVGFEGEERDHLLGAYCPNLLFPYAREAVSDLVNRGSFPQLLLQPINFDALYADARARQADGAEAPTH